MTRAPRIAKTSDEGRHGRHAVEQRYSLVFPDELYRFHEFWQKNAALCACLDLMPGGPFSILDGTAEKDFDPGSDFPRMYNDPPEFFTVMLGHTDGLHWGYWFDDPDDRGRAPVVASYYHSDCYEMSIPGATLFEALREHLELFHRDAVVYTQDDPSSAPAYAKDIAAYARVREAMCVYALGDRKEIGDEYFDKYSIHQRPVLPRHPVAMTRNRMGIVLPEAKYKAIAARDVFQAGKPQPTQAAVDGLVAKARRLAQGGYPGAALKLGHDLWGYKPFHPASYEMLEIAYAELGRMTLRAYLAKAVAFRLASDAKAARHAGARRRSPRG